MRDRVWHVGTVSKTLSPGLRVGWLVPPPAHRESILERKQAADLQAGSLAQVALAALLDQLDYDRHVARARQSYAERAARMIAALRRRAPRSWRFTEPEGGFAVWLQTDLPIDGAAALERAIADGVSFDPGHLFLPGGDGEVAGGPLALRLSFSSAPIDALERGVARLVASLTSAGGSS
jgi:2-aminoadipate transaminase